jgi:glycosyltransferase involved in cell wall biosynthesis
MPPDAPTAAPAGRIAVLIPVYNEGGRLRDTLESLRAQSVAFTAVLVDDGSTPPLHVDADAYEYPIVVHRMARNGGIEAALNAGLELIEAQGFELVARLDVGDRCTPTRLATQQAFLDRTPDVHLVGSDVEWRHDDGSLAFSLALPSTHHEIARALHHTVCLIHPTVMFRAHVLRAVGRYSYDYPAAEDFEFFWRIANRFQVANVSEVLLVTRYDRDGISVRRRRRQLRSKLRIQLENFRIGEPLSFVGVAKTLALMSVPYAGVVALKRALSRDRAA